MLSFDELRAFLDDLKAQGLKTAECCWGITRAAVLRGAGRPTRTITGSETDSVFERYDLPDGVLWSIDLMSEDSPTEGIPYYSAPFAVGAPAIAARADAIDTWLDANRDAYDLFVPIKWSAAPERAREAKAFIDFNRARLNDSPLAEMYADLERELTAVIGDTK